MGATSVPAACYVRGQPPPTATSCSLTCTLPPADGAPSAAGRLEDKSSLVRKEALRLLQALMLHNPFGPKLPSDRFEASLAAHKAMLEQLLPPEAAEDAIQEGIQVQAAQDATAEAASVKAEPGAEPAAEEMEVDGQAEGNARQPQQEEGVADEGGEAAPVQTVRSRECLATPCPALPLALRHACFDLASHVRATAACTLLPARPIHPYPRCVCVTLCGCLSACPAAAEVGWDGTLEELQALVASLELAVAFSRDLTQCMPTITQVGCDGAAAPGRGRLRGSFALRCQMLGRAVSRAVCIPLWPALNLPGAPCRSSPQLLASSTISDVQESIAMLLTCKQFEVDGAPDTIRRMLPLIFAKDQGAQTPVQRGRRAVAPWHTQEPRSSSARLASSDDASPLPSPRCSHQGPHC